VLPDRAALQAKLSALLAAITPSWPAESAAMAGLSALPADLAAAAQQQQQQPGAAAQRAAAAAASPRELDAASSAAAARQLAKAGCALAGLVVAVMAWQLAAALPGERARER
jgi:hypothetical protein